MELVTQKTYNVYCDESCHLENDHQKVMVLGATWCLKERSKEAFDDLRSIKLKHGLNRSFELKWNKVSPGKIDFYLDVARYYCKTPWLNYRGLVVQDKSVLDHPRFNQTHDEWYYKAYYDMLKHILNESQSTFSIYIDEKDTCGVQKIDKLCRILNNTPSISGRVHKIQEVKSDQVELVQLADFISGALMYANKGELHNTAKVSVIEAIEDGLGIDITRQTAWRAKKFSVLNWRAR